MDLGEFLSSAFTVVAVIAALWSLWWIINASRKNPGEREAEVQARQRVAQGGSWEAGAGAAPPKAFTDAEITDLSEALAPQTPEEAGVDVRPAEPRARRRRRKR